MSVTLLRKSRSRSSSISCCLRSVTSSPPQMTLRTLPSSSSSGAVDQAITISSPRRLTNVFSQVAAGCPGFDWKRARTSSRSSAEMKTSQKYS